MQKQLTNFTEKRVGVIGCGSRACNLIPFFKSMGTNASVTDVCDLDTERALGALKNCGVDVERVKTWSSVDDMLDHAALDGVMVMTMWEAHAEIAKKVLARNIPLFLEKPLTFLPEEMTELRDAYERSDKLAMVSHPLTVSPLFELVKEIVASGRIGTPEHIQAFNDVSYGGVYFHSKYRTCGRAGLFYEKSTHDFDWINDIAGAKPVEVAAMASQTVFGGNEPKEKLCAECTRQLVCPESPFMQKNFVHDHPHGEFCSFAEDVTVYDSAGVLIRYENGIHANYSENHVVRKQAGRRGGRIIGYAGTLDFNWGDNSITVTRHHHSVTERHQLDPNSDHSGGDERLIFDFVKLMHGVNDTAVSMQRGLTTNLVAIAAQKSLEEHVFAPVIWSDGRTL